MSTEIEPPLVDCEKPDKEIDEVEVGDRLNVVIQRLANHSGHFISYPLGKPFDSSRDGIHLDLSGDQHQFVRDVLSFKDTYVTAQARVTDRDGFLMGKLLSLENIIVRQMDNSGYGPVNDLAEEYSDRIDQKRLVIHLEEHETAERGSSLPKQKISKNTGQPELPPEPNDPKKTFLYYVDTSHAECYHTTRHCEQIKKRAGELRFIQKDIENPLPEEISNLRRCHVC